MGREVAGRTLGGLPGRPERRTDDGVSWRVEMKADRGKPGDMVCCKWGKPGGPSSMVVEGRGLGVIHVGEPSN